jgi:hypothetical protein
MKINGLKIAHAISSVGFFHSVDMGNTAGVSEVYAASTFRVKCRRRHEFLCIGTKEGKMGTGKFVRSIKYRRT